MAVRGNPKEERDIWIWRTDITEVFLQLHSLSRIKQTQCSFFTRSLSTLYQTCQHVINNEQWPNWGLRPPGTGTYTPRILDEAHREDINKLAELAVHSRADANIWIIFTTVNPLNPELNPIYYLLALLGAHHFLHVSRIRVKLLTFRQLMSYIYGAPILDVSRSHTTTQHSR